MMSKLIEIVLSTILIILFFISPMMFGVIFLVGCNNPSTPVKAIPVKIVELQPEMTQVEQELFEVVVAAIEVSELKDANLSTKIYNLRREMEMRTNILSNMMLIFKNELDSFRSCNCVNTMHVKNDTDEECKKK